MVEDCSFPFLIALFIDSVLYFPNPAKANLIIGICIVILGSVIGIAWATKIFKSKNGTIWFLSRRMATPELDKKEDED